MTEKPESLNNQALLLSSRGNYEDAIECLKRAIILDRKNKLLWFNLGLTYRDFGDIQKAENALKNAYILDRENEEILETYATICFTEKKFALAMNLCNLGIKLNSQNPNFWNLYGAVKFNKEEYKEACDFFEKAVSLNPFYADALYNLRDTYIQMNNKVGWHSIQKQIDDLKL